MDDLHLPTPAAPSLCASLRHPLTPLDAAEIQQVVAIIRADAAFGLPYLFEVIELKEPSQAALAAYRAGQPCPREARANIFLADAPGVWRLSLSLADNIVTAKSFHPEARPMIQLEQFIQIEDIVRAHPDFIAACAKRGVTDMSKVCVDPWSAGNFGVKGEEGGYLSHTFCWLRLYENENFYAHPIEGINAVVDIKAGKVIRVGDYGVLPIPMAEFNYEAQFRDDFRPALKPLDIIQPEGASFVLKGREISWDKWRCVIGFNAREGLTLHDISYDGRPIVARASIAEMVVPYGVPEGGHFRKNVFDIGEYGLGKLTNSLKLGCDCLGYIAYLDAALNTMEGGIFEIEKAICIHEEDNGILWKHWDFRTERTEVRRGRKLVISSICTVGNYEYAFYWYFDQAGEIEFEMKATGIINTSACLPGQPTKYGVEVAPGLQGHIHQHAFCARLEMAVDGPGNSIVECNTYAEEDEARNPYGNAFYQQDTMLKTELEACRKANPATQRYWKVINPNKLNHTGKPVGYKLMPESTLTPFFRPGSPSGIRSNFMQNHLWVTKFSEEERFPAGEYMNHSDGSGGVADFVKQDRALENTDLVLWHVFGLHHQPRPEDFPVQPCIKTGFKLMPVGFFNQNPGIDIAPETNRASKLHGGGCCGH
ncbi:MULTISPECIES: primary-amine oxidase [unclassified Acidocella]|uniref:primary-amine oxidase n=1 Tax=unclassified Acidocella TaxID=2648610 RepID=UPI00028D1A7E|nr:MULTISPECIES: primary-amine oxidase [unclassified Acidocella]EKM98905.1 tyramine oxidase [Acidocella sp. MX-AZ02]WBO58696.1 primary-amine oxidase [Acidocella sp. MX-AZ03]